MRADRCVCFICAPLRGMPSLKLRYVVSGCGGGFLIPRSVFGADREVSTAVRVPALVWVHAVGPVFISFVQTPSAIFNRT